MIKIATTLQYFIDNPQVSSMIKGGQLVQVFRNENTKTTNVTYFKDGTQRVDIRFKPEKYGMSKLVYTGTNKDIDSLHSFIYGEEN